MRGLCFEIFNIFAASGALAGQFEFADDDDVAANSSLMKLHNELAERRALELLLRLSMLVRTYDDIMMQSEHAEIYAAHAAKTSGEDYIGTLDTGELTLREACNKIIHAREVRPIYDDVQRDIEEGKEPERVWHLRGEIERMGYQNKKEWNAVVYVPPFLEIVLDRIEFGWGQ